MNHFVKIMLAASIFALSSNVFAQTTPTNNISVSPEERAKIEQVVHEYLLKKPEVLVEALQLLQKKQYEDAQQVMKKTQADALKFADALFHHPGDATVGKPNAKVTIVEFFDYQCPHCVDMAPVIADLVKSNQDVRIVFKDFPIRGPLSEFAARAAIAANLQGKYYEFNHALLTSNQQLTQDQVFKLAKDVGLDVEKLKKDITDPKVTELLVFNTKLGEQDLKLFGTPAFFIGKTDVKKDNGTISYIPGQMSKEQLQNEIDKAAKS